jgi:acyl-coenzyme A synthetase/AMP-(fatty) acid ligase
MFKCGGYRVYPSHVESILNSHTDVLQSCVVRVDDDIKGAKPYAFVILKKDQYISEESLKLYSIENGPAYQHPRKIWFLKEFPLTGSNKIDKKELVRQAIEQLATEK